MPHINKNIDNSKAKYLQALAPQSSVFVSANAGAGKTSLLANRVLSLLLKGTPPARILCLTFTNAAAAEMSNRILKRLGDWVMMEEHALEESLAAITGSTPDTHFLERARGLFAQVLEAPEGIRIHTLHGFCQSLLNRFPLEAGISPHFSVMDASTEQEMLKEAKTRLFSHAQEEAPPLRESIHALAHVLSEQGLHTLLAEITSHKRKFSTLFAVSNGPEHAVEMLWSLYKLDRNTTLHDLLAAHLPYDDAARARLQEVVRCMEQGNATDCAAADVMARWLEDGALSLDEYISLFITADGGPRKKLSGKNTLPEALAEWLAGEQQRVMAFCQARNRLEIARHSTHVLCVAEALLAIYTKLKLAYARMDYDDLILHARALLRRPGISPWVLFKLDGGIDHVLVDEAQDTSAEQWDIIDAITQEFFAGQGRSEESRSLFVVGDEKQSIFSFQGADVQSLGHRQRYFIGRIEAAALPAHRIDLTASFRSTPEVLAAVDAVFAQPHARKGLMFGEGDLAHTPTRLTHKGLVELWPLVVTEDEENAAAVSVKLAKTIADTIRSWLDEGVWLESKGRAVEPGDIMVLVKSRKQFVDQLSRALKRRNIPVAGIDRMVLTDNLAVKDLMALAQFLLLPEDDLTLAGLLKSPICNVSEEELFTLAHGRTASLWQRVQEQRGKTHALLADLRARADYTRPYELFAYALDNLGARGRILGRMGEEYADPIDEFLAQALLYERSHTPSLQGFLHWLEGGKGEIKRDMEQARSSVRIMTVHGAKGLQAPIVIVPDTTEPPQFREPLLWHENTEAALPLWPRSSKRDDALCAALRSEEKEAMYAEYRRLLYVALTRAEDRLYIGGATSRETPSEESWYQLVKSGLQAIAAQQDGVLRLGEVPERKKIAKAALHKKAVPRHIAFLEQAPPEPVPSKPLSPSKLPGDEPAGASPMLAKDTYIRGAFIHALLQHLPLLNVDKRAAAAWHLAASYQRAMDDKTIADAIAEALMLMNDTRFSFLFGPQAIAEAPVAGVIDIAGKKLTVAGQIDRLVIGDKDVWIVDYKTNRQPPVQIRDTPKAYLRQLALYQALLARIYPAKTVRCALLWTATLRLDEANQALLDEALLSSYI